jgi:hypothetical protein
MMVKHLDKKCLLEKATHRAADNHPSLLSKVITDSPCIDSGNKDVSSVPVADLEG